jgi:hypothetical protein
VGSPVACIEKVQMHKKMFVKGTCSWKGKMLKLEKHLAGQIIGNEK